MAIPQRIVTERLLLRPVQASDASDTARLMTPDVSQRLSTFPSPMSMDQAEARIAANQESLEKREGVVFAILERQSGQLMGWIGYWIPEAQPETAAIGYWLGTEFQGLGYTIEAARATAEHAAVHLGARTLQGTASFDNPPSVRVLEKLDMVLMREQVMHLDVPDLDLACGVYERSVCAQAGLCGEGNAPL